MARPALSAVRSVAIIDFLASFPGSAFSLSEIAKATKINAASCHAVLSALTEHGYLTRSEANRNYLLGPVLAAVGDVATKSQPLLARAREAAVSLHDELDIPVMLTCVVGDDILCVASHFRAGGQDPGMNVGERLPLVPPVGMPFFAWSPEIDVARWIARHEPPADEGLVARWRESLELTRQRGYQVTSRSTDDAAISTLMAELASGRRAPYYRDAVTRLFNSFDRQMAQPTEIEPKGLYEIVLIAAPIFDQNGAVAFSLCLGGFAERVRGTDIIAYADRLVQTCLRAVREDRSNG